MVHSPPLSPPLIVMLERSEFALIDLSFCVSQNDFDPETEKKYVQKRL